MIQTKKRRKKGEICTGGIFKAFRIGVLEARWGREGEEIGPGYDVKSTQEEGGGGSSVVSRQKMGQKRRQLTMPELL